MTAPTPTLLHPDDLAAFANDDGTHQCTVFGLSTFRDDDPPEWFAPLDDLAADGNSCRFGPAKYEALLGEGWQHAAVLLCGEHAEQVRRVGDVDRMRTLARS